jgi:CheY-like chemotaxis protein
MLALDLPAEALMGASSSLDPAGARPGSPLRRLHHPSFDHALVLLVDDEPVNLIVASEMLSFIGIKPLMAANGAEAVALACELRLDLILMDLQMPVLDGFAATAQIRRLEREHSRRRVPVVAYTSDLVCGDLSRLRESGIFAVLEKHADLRTFRECVMRWCLPDDKGNPAASARTDLPLHQQAARAQLPITETSSTRRLS